MPLPKDTKQNVAKALYYCKGSDVGSELCTLCSLYVALVGRKK